MIRMVKLVSISTGKTSEVQVATINCLLHELCGIPHVKEVLHNMLKQHKIVLGSNIHPKLADIVFEQFMIDDIDAIARNMIIL